MWHFVGKLNKLSRSIGAYRARRIGEEELLPHHHSLVFAICREEGGSQDALAQMLMLNKSTVARSLATLEEKGLVERRPSPDDKRVLLVYPTEKMKELLPRVREVARDWNAAVTDGISEEELTVCESVLTRMIEKAKALLEEKE